VLKKTPRSPPPQQQARIQPGSDEWDLDEKLAAVGGVAELCRALWRADVKARLKKLQIL